MISRTPNKIGWVKRFNNAKVEILNHEQLSMDSFGGYSLRKNPFEYVLHEQCHRALFLLRNDWQLNIVVTTLSKVNSIHACELRFGSVYHDQ